MEAEGRLSIFREFAGEDTLGCSIVNNLLSPSCCAALNGVSLAWNEPTEEGGAEHRDRASGELELALSPERG